MPEYYEHYRFPQSPFGLRRLEPEKKDPLAAQATELGVLLDIDGFTRLAKCQAYLTDRIANNQPAFVVISGSKKSGLSSAAVAVLLKYREAAGLPAERFVPVVLRAPDHSEPVLYTRWISALYAKLQPRLTLDEDVRQRFHQARNFTNQGSLDYDLQGVLNEISHALSAGDGLAFGTALEHVKTLKAIEIGKTVFESTKTICVFTCLLSDAVNVDTLREDTDVHVIDLSCLAAEEVQRVVAARWCNSTDFPFHTATFSEYCAERKHTVGAVMKMADAVLQKRVKVVQAAKGNVVGQWPEDERLGALSEIETLTLLELVSNGDL